MRLDSDSCFKRRIYQNKKVIGSRPNHWHAPGLEAGKLYHAGDVKRDAKAVTHGFGPFVHQYVQKHNVTIQNPTLFSNIPNDPDRPVPLFYNNFEISDVKFMQSPNVRAFHRALSEHEPFGVFRNRWGDAIERYATMALFATPNQLVERAPEGYNHPCS